VVSATVMPVKRPRHEINHLVVPTAAIRFSENGGGDEHAAALLHGCCLQHGVGAWVPSGS
jgi:hypothetical protein